MSQSRARQQQRRRNRAIKRAISKAKKMVRCPVCKNAIVDGDGRPTEEGPMVHGHCMERLEEAKRIQTANRVQAEGLWLPGQR